MFTYEIIYDYIKLENYIYIYMCVCISNKHIIELIKLNSHEKPYKCCQVRLLYELSVFSKLRF